jgi:hypothetical protein
MMLNLFSEAEAGGGDDAAPTLADERSAEEARGVVWRDADEDLLHELVHQLRRRRPRSHAARRGSEQSAGDRDDAAPTLADERSVEEARGVVWRDAEEDLLHKLVHQLRRRRPRSHAARRGLEQSGLLSGGAALL